MKFQTSLFLALGLVVNTDSFGADLRIGIIGCDTSHAVAFTKVINDANDTNHVAGGKVVAAYRGGSKDIPSSIKRVPEYASKLEKDFGVKFFDSIEDLCQAVDVVLLE